LPIAVIIAGVSTRAAAESAARAGFHVTAFDAFADLDQHPSVRARAIYDPFTPAAAVRAARSIQADAVAYVSNFENHPRAVQSLARGRALWGNPPDVIERARSGVGSALRRTINNPAKAGLHDYVVKPLKSGGGHGVRRWIPGTPVPRGCYLQAFIDGTPGSVVFVAAGGRAVPLGVSRQLIGEAAFGTDGFRYCGNILAAAGDAQFSDDVALMNEATALADDAARSFGLVGVNGIDFIARGGRAHAIEINPRWCASMELVERAYGFSVFGAHAEACTAGTLPPFDFARARRSAPAIGKAIVFTRHDVVVGDTRAWLGDEDVRDVPHPGEAIAAGRPVCTVFARAADARACYDALAQRAARVYAELAAWEVVRGVRL
jgi:hypothetical protein